MIEVPIYKGIRSSYSLHSKKSLDDFRRRRAMVRLIFENTYSHHHKKSVLDKRKIKEGLTRLILAGLGR